VQGSPRRRPAGEGEPRSKFGDDQRAGDDVNFVDWYDEDQGA
jgi:hypothetical protein